MREASDSNDSDVCGVRGNSSTVSEQQRRVRAHAVCNGPGAISDLAKRMPAKTKSLLVEKRAARSALTD